MWLAAVVCTPGAGFGACGEGYIRISAFNSLAYVQEAIRSAPNLGTGCGPLNHGHTLRPEA